MQDYFTSGRYTFDRVSFDYFGGRYEGRGFLTWEPNDGFHLEALLQRYGPPLPPSVELGRIGVVSKEELSSIRMKSRHINWAVSPSVPLLRRLDVLDDSSHISIDLSRVIFSQKSWFSSAEPWWHVTATYNLGGAIALPDIVKYETRINTKDIPAKSGWSAKGLDYEDQYKTVIGYTDERDILTLECKFSKGQYSRSLSWSWPQIAADIIAIMIGRTSHLIFRSIEGNTRRYTEVLNQHDVDYLRIFSPFDRTLHIEKSRLFRLTDFLSNNPTRSYICRCIFYQMYESSRQYSHQSRELLMATILEAALRCIDDHPFKRGDNSWKIDDSMESFRKAFLTDKWHDTCKKALRVHRNLRHRNAHPDWLISSGGSRPNDETSMALDDMIFLSRFYGYMILALGGFTNLEPVFPEPHLKWDAPIRVSKANKPS